MKYYIVKMKDRWEEKPEYLEAFTNKKDLKKFIKRSRLMKKPIALFKIEETLLWKDKKYV